MKPLPHMLTAVLCAFCAATATGCAADPSPLAGRVRSDVVTVQVPAIPMPSPDLDAGFGGSPAGPSSSASRVGTVTAITGLGPRARLATVTVSIGDRVRAGDAIAVLESAALEADIAATKAASRAAAAQVRVLDAKLDDLAETRADLEDARFSATDAVGQLQSTRKQLVAQRAQLAALLASIERMRPPGGGVPGGVPPGVVPPGGAPTGTAPPGTVPPGRVPPRALPDPAELRAGISKLDSGIARIDAGLAKARSGLAKLAGARATVADARATLFDIRAVARIAASTARVPIDLATLRRELAVVSAPTDGVIVSVATVGAMLAPGATLATIDADDPPQVSVWLPPGEASQLEIQLRGGDVTASVSADWSAGASAEGRVVRVGPRAKYPPTSLATTEVHLARAVEVTLEFPDPRFALPTGAPVNVRIR